MWKTSSIDVQCVYLKLVVQSRKVSHGQNVCNCKRARNITCICLRSTSLPNFTSHIQTVLFLLLTKRAVKKTSVPAPSCYFTLHKNINKQNTHIFPKYIKIHYFRMLKSVAILPFPHRTFVRHPHCYYLLQKTNKKVALWWRKISLSFNHTTIGKLVRKFKRRARRLNKSPPPPLPIMSRFDPVYSFQNICSGCILRGAFKF